MNNSADLTKRQLLSMLAHGSIFLSTFVFSIGIPIALLFVSEDDVVKANAREAINFHLNYWVLLTVFGLLTVLLIGWPLLALLFVVHLALPILAMLHSYRNSDVPFQYPFIIRVV
ncbi:MAG: DUF4870 domain-containing protein [Kaiparowitsia implicata GSE-PSE-MK54-09C]|jgi:uncharacterized Tic20 family protein|nr:DUF4870 domain-containing protein [Kaiparowitsia implicata GSE-PSE-MK54-09C]